MNSHFMVHSLKPILFIDDRKEGDERGERLITNLPSNLKKIVDLHACTDQLLKKLNEMEVELFFDPSIYEIVFLHHSYKNPLLNESQLSDLRDKLRLTPLIILSGGSKTDSKLKTISRTSLFQRFKNALEAYEIMGVFPIAYLFQGNSKVNRFYPLLNQMYQTLEDDGKEGLLAHPSFEKYISILKLDLEKVRKNFRANFNESQLSDKILEWRLNTNI